MASGLLCHLQKSAASNAGLFRNASEGNLQLPVAWPAKQYHSRHSYFGDAYHIRCRMRQRRRIHGAAASSVAFCVRTLLSDAGWAGFDLISTNNNAGFFLGRELDALGNISPDLLSLCPTFVEPRMMQSSSNNGSSGEIEVRVLKTSRRYDRPPN